MPDTPPDARPPQPITTGQQVEAVEPLPPFQVQTSQRFEPVEAITALVAAWQATGNYDDRLCIAVVIVQIALRADGVEFGADELDLVQQVLHSLANGDDAEGILFDLRQLT